MRVRVKEWYGWHFPEMTKIVLNNMQHAKFKMEKWKKLIREL
jgi:RNA processing factor Prp31